MSEISVQNLTEDLRETSKELLTECEALVEVAREYAEKENTYRLAKAKAMLRAEGKTVDLKKAEVDLICEKERLASHIAEGVLDATRERVRSLRAVLSALQTISGSHKAEAEFTRTGPSWK